MFDITLCTGTNCPKKDNCERYTYKSYEPYQSYFEAPIENGVCRFFIKNTIK